VIFHGGGDVEPSRRFLPQPIHGGSFLSGGWAEANWRMEHEPKPPFCF
jgi:hypothetical protein